MKKLLTAAVLTLLLLTGCGNTFHADFTGENSSLRLYIAMNGTTASDLIFTIHGIDYTVASSPTVSDPVYALATQENDGMQSVILHMPDGENKTQAELHMLHDDGSLLIYSCPSDELQPLLRWQAVN